MSNKHTRWRTARKRIIIVALLAVVTAAALFCGKQLFSVYIVGRVIRQKDALGLTRQQVRRRYGKPELIEAATMVQGEGWFYLHGVFGRASRVEFDSNGRVAKVSIEDPRSRYGFTLTRNMDDTVRISWGGGRIGSGLNISPERTLETLFRYHLKDDGSLDDVWMFDIPLRLLGTVTPASYVNPLNVGSVDRMFEVIRLCKGGNSNADAVTRIVAQEYTYLGWVVMNDGDVKALKAALANRAEVDLNADISTSEGVLYRLSPGVEKHLTIRQTIPVMFEVLDPRAGHPCDAMHVLYLDGHVARIPVGERFPATQAFLESFRPRKLPP
jgi:prepilin-type processing-associated H-X9-DG protein